MVFLFPRLGWRLQIPAFVTSEECLHLPRLPLWFLRLDPFVLLMTVFDHVSFTAANGVTYLAKVFHQVDSIHLLDALLARVFAHPLVWLGPSLCHRQWVSSGPDDRSPYIYPRCLETSPSDLIANLHWRQMRTRWSGRYSNHRSITVWDSLMFDIMTHAKLGCEN